MKSNTSCCRWVRQALESSESKKFNPQLNWAGNAEMNCCQFDIFNLKIIRSSPIAFKETLHFLSILLRPCFKYPIKILYLHFCLFYEIQYRNFLRFTFVCHFKISIFIHMIGNYVWYDGNFLFEPFEIKKKTGIKSLR